MDFLQSLLDKYCVTKDFQKEIREGYRVDIENTLKNIYDAKCNFRYGGSLAKSTANTNSCDIDLLTYLDNSTQKSLKEIYDITYDELKKNYICIKKNSAITINRKNDEKWDYTVDVVPGKFSSNDDSNDVYLWQNKSNSRLKTNPEIQIETVKQSKSKEVIRIIKLYREFNNFKFKSFFLEIFAIDVVETEYSDSDRLIDKLVKFCSKHSEIGVKKIFDPANSNNDIMNIHNQEEFSIIRDKIKELYEVLMTNNEEAIVNCILGKAYDIDQAYLNNTKNYSLMKYKKNGETFAHNIKCYYKDGNNKISFTNDTILQQNLNLIFEISIHNGINVTEVTWLITNSGYCSLSDNCLRGNTFENSDNISRQKSYEVYMKEEHTSYYGNHFVQAKIKTKNNNIFFSNIAVVRIR